LSKIIASAQIHESRIRVGRIEKVVKERVVREAVYLELKEKLEAEVAQSYQKGFQKGVEQGRQNGYSEGLDVGQAEAKKIEAQANQTAQQARQTIEQFKSLLVEVNNQKNNLYLSAEREILELAILLAKKIIRTYAQNDQNIVLDTIKQALPILVEKSNLILKVAPDQEKFIRDNMEDIMMMDNELKKIKIETDRRVGAGGVILETDSGRVDARLEKQLETLVEAVKKEIPEK